MKIEELLSKYGKTVEEIEFDYKDLSDEELEVKFAEVFGECESDEDGEESSESEESEEYSAEEGEANEDDGIEDVENNACGGGGSSPTKKKKKNNSREFNTTFELSFDEVHMGLNALCSIYRNEDEWCYVRKVYTDHFIMEDWDSDKIYKQSYTQDGDNLTLSGERTEMFAMLLTESEKIALEEMRANYSIIEEKLGKYEKAELDAEKAKVFEDESYSKYLESDEFKELMKNKDNYSVEELKDKAEIAFAKCVKKEGTFSLNTKSDTKIKRHTLGASKDAKKKPYGNIFNSETK